MEKRPLNSNNSAQPSAIPELTESREQLRLLASMLPVSLVGGILVGLVVSALLWNQQNAAWVLGWLLGLLILTLARAGVLIAYRRAQDPIEQVWRRRFFLGNAASGLVWGAASIALFSPINIVEQVLLGMAIAGVAAGASTSLSPHRPSYSAFLLLALLPYGLRSAMEGSSVSWTMAALTLLFVIGLMGNARRSHQHMMDNVKLRIEDQNKARELERREQAEIQAREFQEAIINSLPGLFYLLDDRQRIIFWNRRFRKRSGLRTHQLKKKPLADLCSLDDMDVCRNQLQQALESGSSQFEASLVNAKGRHNVYLFNNVRVCLDDKNVIIGTASDISEMLQVRKALQASEQRFRDVSEATGEYLWESDAQGNYRFLTDKVAEIRGMPAAELMGSPFNSGVFPADLDAVNAAFEQAGQSPDPFTIEFRHQLAEDEIRWERVTGIPLFDEHGRPSGFRGAGRNITRQKQAEVEQCRLVGIIDKNPEFIATIDLKGRLSFANTAAREFLGLAPDAELGALNLRRFMPRESLTLFLGVAVPSTYKQRFWQGESRMLRDGKHVVPVSMMVVLHEAALGFERFFSLFVRDITEQKQAGQALLEARDSAESADRAKSAFLAAMSHEIRTPMNGILGMLQILDDSPLQPDQRGFVDTMENSAQGLLSIINEILDFSKAQAGRMVLAPIDFDLAHTVHDVGLLMVANAEQKGLELVIDYAADCPHEVHGDAGRIRQVLLNLVGNAIKFTHQGHVLIRVSGTAGSEESGDFHIEIQDTGIGIDSQDKSRLFDAFQQLDSTTTREYGGTGLGLAISRELVELMGGHIDVISDAGQGSCFSLSLPLQIARPPEVLPRADLNGRRVLLATGGVLSRQVLARQLREAGMHTDELDDACDIATCLSRARQEQRPFDAVVMELEDNFEELVRALRQDPDSADAVLVGLSPVSVRGDAQRAQQAGFDAFVTKPVHRPLLLDTLSTTLADGVLPVAERHFITRYTVAESERPRRDVDARFSGRVLLAEDNDVNQQVARLMLEGMGLDVDVVGDGEGVLSALETDSYGLVFMDCQMPLLDGISATRIIRRETGPEQLPIIALSANVLPQDRESCLSAGMNDFLAKPISREELARSLRQWYPESAQGETAASTQPSPHGVTRDIESPRSEAVLEWTLDHAALDALKELVGNEFDNLVWTFLLSTEEILQGMDAALAAQDRDELLRHGHSLKSSAGHLGALALSARARALEQGAAEQEDFDELGRRVAALRDEFERARVELETRVTDPNELGLT